MEARYFSKKVVEWYQQNKRSLPWRNTKDPYKIWLSEIILQQTRVSQGLPYYQNFVQEFPNVHALASASEQKVLRLWQGLGYYTRARNLHKAAKEISTKHKGVFPSSFEELKKLPGIGEYTAAAIASISFGEAVAVVDGNVFRVLARVFGIDKPINSQEGKKYFSSLANQLLDKKQPATFNQAVMEFGALHCTPKNPQCSTCSFNATCIANKSNLQSALPYKLASKKSRRRYFYYIVIRKGNSLLMNLRKGNDIWKGLYDFYLIEKSRLVKTEHLLNDDLFLKKLKPITIDVSTSVMYKHILSHQSIRAKFITLNLAEKPSTVSVNLNFYSLKKVGELPKPVLISRFLSDFRLL
ncbi:MAG: A/G-specific adenine glycosylase [Cyclobacteriaceae bacterium]|nr:A/G-specific adenine glycosylase [Cyclobacteriaceae bacterium]UYN88448.1 MAG: A/G-specific adenine glycosylase [Cyclobacteriaceae bacterium]